MNFPSDELRETMRQWTTGVAIVCCKNRDQIHGMTVNSFTSVSLNPPLIIVTLANQSRTHHIVKESGLFSVSILKDTQKMQADKFSGKLPEGENRFAGIETFHLPGGIPAIVGSLAVLECSVKSEIPLDQATLFMAEVTYTHVENDGKPLIYHNREYHTI